MKEFIEIFTLATGLVYLVLEILQKNAMWIVGIVTSAAAVYMFATEALYASMALNVYYVAISVIGFAAWRRDSSRLHRRLEDADGYGEAAGTGNGNPTAGTELHLNRLSGKTILWSALLSLAGTAALVFLLKLTGDSMPYLDAAIAVLNAVATWWLSRSYYQQWYILIFVNILSSILCFTQGLYWMTAQYVFYSASSVLGLMHWRRNGAYVG